MHQLTGVSKDFKILKDASGQYACFTKVPQILSSRSFPLKEAELANIPRESSLSPSEKLAGFLRPLVRREKEMGKQRPLVIVESISCVRLFATPWRSMPGFLSFTISWSLLKLVSIKSVMPSNHLVLYHPFLLLPLIFPSIRIFSDESALCIQSIGDSASVSVFPVNVQAHAPQLLNLCSRARATTAEAHMPRTCSAVREPTAMRSLCTTARE